MTLKMKLDSLDGLSNEDKSHYIENSDTEQGGYIVEGYEDPSVLKKTLDKVRLEGKIVSKSLKEMQAKFGGIDLDAALEAQNKVKELEEQGMLDKKDWDAWLASKTKVSKDAYELKISKLEEDNEKANSSLREHVINAEALNELNAIGVLRKNSIKMAIKEVGDKFHFNEEQKIVARSGEIGKDGVTPLNIKEEAGNFYEMYPHFFEKSEGANGKGSGGSGLPSNADTSQMSPSARLNYARSIASKR